jgi:Reverse transcriptase (RNA-dependent DNA polymerase)
MTVRCYIHSIAKRAEITALVDSGATENFLNLTYARWLKLPIKTLAKTRKLFNVDGTENKAGELRFYTDLQVQTGGTRTQLRFFLSDLGEHKAILGYSWFAAVQPNIDWKRGWIDHTQLPVILRAHNAKRAKFVPRQHKQPRRHQPNQYFVGRVTVHPTNTQDPPKPEIPKEYKRHEKVFSEEKSQRLPQHTIWDHAIELLPNAPATLPARLLPLNYKEREEMQKFVEEHLKRGTIRESWSPYAANFFFIKKKDGKLRPVQDYRPINKWTKKNRNVSPLIPQTIDRLSGCTLFTKFDVRWGYNNVRIKEGDEWKAAFLTPEGLFEPTVMFFGLTNSPATFQMMMNTIFRTEVAQGWLSVYMDDLAIHAKPKIGETEQQHLDRHRRHTHHILDKLKENDLYLKPEKCEFEKDEIEYLGVIIGRNHLRMDPKKLKGVADWPVPRNPTKV